MATSDLTLSQILQMQQPGVDPAVAAIAPRMQLAQAMMQDGTNTGPANKWGGLARLAQALTGSYMFNNAQQGMQDIAAQRQKDALTAGAFMNGGTVPDAPPAAPAAPVQQGAPSAPASGSTLPPATQVEPPALSGAVHQLESSGSMKPGITGDGGAAAGPMQVHQGALTDVNRAQGTNYTLADLTNNPALGKQVGDAYLAQQQARFPGRPDLALAAFNAGPTATQAAVNSGAGVAGLPASTQAYVAKGQQLAGAQPPAAQQPAPQTGADNPSIANGLAMIHRAQQAMLANPYNPLIQKQAQMVIDNAHTLMGLDTFSTGANGVQTNLRTGQQVSAAVPNAHFVETPTGSVDTTGTHAPTYMPSPRVAQTPNGGTLAVGPGGTVTQVAAPDNAGVAARHAAESQGGATGTAAAATVGKMAQLGGEADTAIGNIDYGMNQLHQAAAGGINSGYFAPWLATAAAAGKSLGVDLHGLGIDPTAVGNAQSAQKTLGVVAGTILQNTIGKDSAITDAKIEHFIHTQPGIETDPEAINRVLGWARSQFVYNRNMAMDAMSNVDPQSGMIPPGWQASYYKKAGAFAPIYDPLSQEMKQPAGDAPAQKMPVTPAAPETPATQQASGPAEGATATHPDGRKAVFTGGKWIIQPAQAAR